MNRKALLVGLALAAPLLLVLAVSFRYDPKLVASPLVGKPAPGFALADLEGEVHRLDGLLGRPVVINFWATYCPPCYEEHPVFLAAARHYRDRVHFLGVIYQDDPELIARWEEQLGAWGPTLIDHDGTVAIAYGVYGPPETFFIDRQGRIVEKIIGGVSAPAMEQILERLL